MKARENYAQVVLYILWENMLEVTECSYKSHAIQIKTVSVLSTLLLCEQSILSLYFPRATPRKLVWLGKTEVWPEPHLVWNDDVDDHMVCYFAL